MRRLVLAALLPLFTLLAVPAGAVTIERVVSPGGIEAWLIEDHGNPIISMEVAFRGGASVEPAARNGLAHMTASLLDEGAGPLDSQAFQARLEDQAIELAFDVTRDRFRGHLKTLTSHRDSAFDLFRLALTQPRFDREPVARIRSEILTELARERQSPETVASHQWFAAEFPHHPYGRPVHGTPETIKTVTTADLRAYVKAQLARDALIIGVSGDVTPEELKGLLDNTFGTLPAHAAVPAVAETSPAAGGRTAVIGRDNPQSVAVFGGKGVKRADSDWYAAYVMNYILGGGGFSSRLTDEVREKRGLAYSVYTYLLPLEHAGVLIGGVATENARLAESLHLIRSEFTRLREAGPTDKELEDAKTFLIGSFPLQLNSTMDIASLLVTIQFDRLGIDYLDKRAKLLGAVTMADIRRVATRLLDPQALDVVVVGKPEGLENR